MDTYAFWHPDHTNLWFYANTPEDARIKVENWIWQTYAIASENNTNPILSLFYEAWVVVRPDGLYTDNELKYECNTSAYFAEYMRRYGKEYSPTEAAKKMGIGTLTDVL